MELVPAEPAQSAPLWRLWRGLPRHPNVIEALDDRLLRYAALDWMHVPVALADDPAASACAATWGIELVRVYEFLAVRVREDELGWLAAPIVKIDLEGEARVAFDCASDAPGASRRLPPEVTAQWPRCDARGLVFVVGQALRGLVRIERAAENVVGAIIERCVQHDPAQRFATLEALRDALIAAGGRRKPTLGVRSARPVWDLLEAGLGYLAFGSAEPALRCFHAALKRAPRSARARACRDEAAWRVRLPTGIALPWSEAEPIAARLMQQRAFREAFTVCATAVAAEADVLAVETATAACCSQLGDHAGAIEHAERALRHAPDHPEARAIRADSLLHLRDFSGALAAADAWIAAAPDDGHAHHVRGKSLRGLGRLPEARSAFARACAVTPQLIAAMLLGHDVDWSMTVVRASAGVAAVTTPELPDHLSELHDLVRDGRIDEALQMLQRTEYGRDIAAQLLLAHLLAFVGRFADALEVFDSASGSVDQVPAALLGKANVLLELDRAAEALSLFERVMAGRPERPVLGDALAGRAQALRRLGREAEADVTFGDYVALAARGSDLRLSR